MRSFLGLDLAGQLDGAAEQQQLLGQRGLAGVRCAMIAKVRRRATARSMSSAMKGFRSVAGLIAAVFRPVERIWPEA